MINFGLTFFSTNAVSTGSSVPPEEPGGGIQLLLDNFDGTGNLSAHTSNSGATWISNVMPFANSESDGDASLVVENGVLNVNHRGWSRAAQSSISLSNNYDLEINLNLAFDANWGGYQNLAFALNYTYDEQEQTATGYKFEINAENAGSTNVSLYDYAGIGSYVDEFIALNDGSHVLKIEVRPTSITMFIDNNQIGSAITGITVGTGIFAFKLNEEYDEGVAHQISIDTMTITVI